MRFSIDIVNIYPANPGPGYYEDQTQMSRTGQYFNTKFRSSGSRKWGKHERDFLRISINKG